MIDKAVGWMAKRMMTGENKSECLWIEEGQFMMAWYVKEWPLFLYPKAHMAQRA